MIEGVLAQDDFFAGQSKNDLDRSCNTRQRVYDNAKLRRTIVADSDDGVPISSEADMLRKEICTVDVLGKRLSGRLVGRRIAESSLESLALPLSASLGRVVSWNSIQGVVQTQLRGKFSNDPGIRYGDGTYYLPTLEEVKLILASSQLDRRTWTAERFDCDDFAYVLKGEMSVHAYDTGDLRFGLCVGMVWGNFDWVTGFHAVNWFIASDGVLRFIEPQSDTIYDVPHCQGDISLFVV